MGNRIRSGWRTITEGVRRRPALLIASTGRSGSTMLYYAIEPHYRGTKHYHFHFQDGGLVNSRKGDAHNPPRHRVLYTSIGDAPERLDNTRVIHLVADPIDVAISHNEGGREHGRTRHLITSFVSKQYCYRSMDYARQPHWPDEDTMNLAGHFESWYRSHAFPTLFVKYAALWDHLDQLRTFADAPLVLPPRKARRVDSRRHPLRERLEATYGELRRRIDEAPSVRLWPTLG